MVIKSKVSLDNKSNIGCAKCVIGVINMTYIVPVIVISAARTGFHIISSDGIILVLCNDNSRIVVIPSGMKINFHDSTESKLNIENDCENYSRGGSYEMAIVRRYRSLRDS